MTQELQKTVERSMSIVEVKNQVGLVQQVMKEVMQKGQHYGTIPGCGQKPTLFKPGAEKLLLTFRLAPSYEIVSSQETDTFIMYSIRCILTHINAGNTWGSGIGACNSKENKYIKNANPWDLQNTLMKMAEKRALVAAVLNATAASDIFTQDIEDMKPNKGSNGGKATPPQAKQPPKDSAFSVISANQGKRMFAIYKGSNWADEQVTQKLQEYGFTGTKDVTADKYEEICGIFGKPPEDIPFT